MQLFWTLFNYWATNKKEEEHCKNTGILFFFELITYGAIIDSITKHDKD